MSIVRGRGSGVAPAQRWRGACVVVAALVLGACGSDDGGGSTGPVGSGPEVETVVVPDAGPPMLPPLDDPVLQGLEVDVVRAPEDVDPAVAEAARGGGPGQAVLYGDPTAADPFDRPWALAISHQGSENSEIGALSTQDPELHFDDVEVEQFSQETERAGVLSRGIADHDALADALVVQQAESEATTVELDLDALAGAPERLELITSARFDIGQLNASWDDPGFTPFARWTAPPDASPHRHISVSSYAADPGFELLLRATMGGASIGPQVMPVVWAGDGIASAVRTIDDTLVLVQGESIPLDQLTEFVDALRPATAGDWATLRDQFANGTAPTPFGSMALSAGVLPGGRWQVTLDAQQVDGPWGPFESCTLAASIEFTDGAFGGGSAGSGQCTEHGLVSRETIFDSDLQLVDGYVSSGVARLVLTLDDGSVHEPELVGPDRRVFGLIVPASSRVTSALALDGAGASVADLTPADPTAPPG